MKQQITEEMKIQNEWYKEAKKQTVETLPEFARHLTVFRACPVERYSGASYRKTCSVL